MLAISILYQDEHTLVVQSQTGTNDGTDDLYGQFNMGLHVGDDSGRVLSNRTKLLAFLYEHSGGRVRSLHWLNQIHSPLVADDTPTLPAQSADALISSKTGEGLVIMTADCVPIALFGHTSVACIHAGHQGLANGVIASTVKALGATDMQAVIGACISQANYQISQSLGESIVRQVCDNGLVAVSADELYRLVIVPEVCNKCRLDVVKLATLQLAHLGIEVINDAVPCSYASDTWYSYRRQTHTAKPATGRMAMVVARLGEI